MSWRSSRKRFTEEEQENVNSVVRGYYGFSNYESQTYTTAKRLGLTMLPFNRNSRYKVYEGQDLNSGEMKRRVLKTPAEAKAFALSLLYRQRTRSRK
jgi:hypothetical protein